MAKAKKFEKVVSEEGVKLTLTMAEARALRALFQAVGGSPSRSPRGLTDAIGDALDEIEGLHEGPEWSVHRQGSVYFDNYLDHEPPS